MTVTYNEIYAQLCTLIEPYMDESQHIAPESLLVDDLALDSVHTMEILMEMEDWLDRSIPMNMLPDVQTVDDLVRQLSRLSA